MGVIMTFSHMYFTKFVSFSEILVKNFIAMVIRKLVHSFVCCISVCFQYQGHNGFSEWILWHSLHFSFIILKDWCNFSLEVMVDFGSRFTHPKWFFARELLITSSTSFFVIYLLKFLYPLDLILIDLCVSRNACVFF